MKHKYIEEGNCSVIIVDMELLRVNYTNRGWRRPSRLVYITLKMNIKSSGSLRCTSFD